MPSKKPPSDYRVTEAELYQLVRELNAARLRLGSPKQTLAWFLDFKELDLKTLPPSEIAILSFNLLSTAAISPDEREDRILNWPHNRPVGPLDIKILRRLQSQITQGLQNLFSESGRFVIKGPDYVGVKRVTPVNAKDARLERHSWTKKLEHSILETGFLDALVQGGEYLRVCKRCTKPFVANTKRQEYCTENCSQTYRNDKKKMKKRKPK